MSRKPHSGFTVKSCGKAHPYCRECRPDIATKFAEIGKREAKNRVGRPHTEQAKKKISEGQQRVRKYKYNKWIDEWLSGKVNPEKVTSRIHKWLREFKEECWECGWKGENVTTGRVMIELDHVDGDSSNNSRENLRLLCPNCHSLTPTWRNTKR